MKNKKTNLFVLFLPWLFFLLSDNTYCETYYTIYRNYSCIGFIEKTVDRLSVEDINPDLAQQFFWKIGAVAPRLCRSLQGAARAQFKPKAEFVKFLNARSGDPETSRKELIQTMKSLPHTMVTRTASVRIYKKVYRYYFNRIIKEFGDFYSADILKAPYGWTVFTVETYCEGKQSLPVCIKISKWTASDLQKDLASGNAEHYFGTAGRGRYFIVDPLLNMAEDAFYGIIRKNLSRRKAQCIGFIPDRRPLIVDASREWTQAETDSKSNKLCLCNNGFNIYNYNLSATYQQVDTQSGHWHRLKKLYITDADHPDSNKTLEYIHRPWPRERIIEYVRKAAVDTQALEQKLINHN